MQMQVTNFDGSFASTTSDPAMSSCKSLSESRNIHYLVSITKHESRQAYDTAVEGYVGCFTKVLATL